MEQEREKQTRKIQSGFEGARSFLASGARIWNQFMMFIVVVGALPIIFPQWVNIGNKIIVLAIVASLFATSLFSEIIRRYLEKRKKNTASVVNFQLLSRAILLTLFLHLFGRINGPFFVLYLLVVMESFLSANRFLSNLIVSFMVFATSFEFLLLLWVREAVFDYDSAIAFLIRIISIIFMHAYGGVLAEKIASEQEAENNTREVVKETEKLSQQIKKTNYKLKELSALKDEFVSVASHELRAPMTTIKGYISMILEGDAGKIPPKVKEFLRDAYESNDRMIRLVNNMLNVSRIESGRLIISLQDIQIEQAIDEVVRNFQLEADQHGLELKYFRSKKKLPKVRVDPDRIREVISNIVGNAVNFTPHGHIYVKSYRDDDLVTVSIEDTGVGLAIADQEQLFKKFSQIGVGAPLKKGSGLGLYICKMLINEFGGDIWLNSRVGKGTTFYFSLPVIENHKEKG
ncbi:MAG TPA: ATP-binding protein [Candidatus Bathyarchaeia archaeon]|nr:ATP-binding protein [Candidatus Bathyarchaeia archaeon]